VKSSDAKKLPIGSILIWNASPIYNLVELIEIEQVGRWIIKPMTTISHDMKPVNGELPVYAKDLSTLRKFVEKKPEFVHKTVSSIFDPWRSVL
jgi:hypothetical protein